MHVCAARNAGELRGQELFPWVSLQLDQLVDLLTMPSHTHAGTTKKAEMCNQEQVEKAITLSNCSCSQWDLGLQLRAPSVPDWELSGDLTSPPIRNKKIVYIPVFFSDRQK